MSKIEAKIAKLLAKAEGNPNPHEAEAFMAKAEELMLKYGIEQANLAATTDKREAIITVRITIKNGHGYAAAMASIGFAVGPAFSVRFLQSTMSDGGRILWIIGHTSDVTQAETLVNSLMAQSRTQALHWWKTEGKATYPYYTDNDAYLARREFIYAFASGVRSRLDETRNRVVEDAEPGTALVLVERSKVVDQWVDENMQVRQGRASNRNYGGVEAARAGQQAGREALRSKELK